MARSGFVAHRPMLRLSLLTLLGWVISAGSPLPAVGQDVTALVGATLIDGNGGPPLEDATIVWRGNRITAVGARGSVEVPRGARVLDGTGKYVTPGFIDSNVHLSLYGAGETAVRYFDRNAGLTLEAAQMQLKHGFTTVRDSYGSLLPLMQIRDAIARGDTVGPRMLVAGNPAEDIGNIRAIDRVIRDGRIVDLDAIPYERIFSKPGKGHAW